MLTPTDSSLQFGVQFNSSDVTANPVDPLTDEIRFATAHRLEDGDRVIYNSGQGADVNGLQENNAYLVRALDENTIKLIDPANIPAPAIEITGNDITGNLISETGHGLENLQPVTYRAPAASQFTLAEVDVVGGTLDPGDPDSNLQDANNDNIFLPGHEFIAGDEVIFQSNGGMPIDGLSDQQRYFVIFDPTRPDEIKLALTLAEAIGATGDANANPPVPAIPITPIELTRSPDPAEASRSLSLLRVVDQPIGGLTDGVTYYVVKQSNDTFELASDLNGQNIVTLNPFDTPSGQKLTGASTIGTEGVDLQSTGTEFHSLTIDLTAAGTGTQRLSGVGGVLALATAPTGDGIASASAGSTGGGLIRVAETQTSAEASPSVLVDIGGGSRIRAFDIDVTSLAAEMRQPRQPVAAAGSFPSEFQQPL